MINVATLQQEETMKVAKVAINLSKLSDDASEIELIENIAEALEEPFEDVHARFLDIRANQKKSKKKNKK